MDAPIAATARQHEGGLYVDVVGLRVLNFICVVV